MEWIEINKKKIKIQTLTSFKERIKSFRFILKPIKEGLYFPKKHGINTYFFCQNVDVIMTNQDNEVLFIYPNLRSEKIILPKRKVKNIYLLPLKSCNNVKKGDFIIRKKK